MQIIDQIVNSLWALLPPVAFVLVVLTYFKVRNIEKKIDEKGKED